MGIDIGYDPTDKQSIFYYAKKLEGKTFRQVIEEDDKYGLIIREGDDQTYKVEYGNVDRKGGLGEIIEERYFHYKIDNDSCADFPEAGIELKVSPFKINKNGSKSSKERLIISMINYHDIVNMDFYTSNAWEKINYILLVYYLWTPEAPTRLDYKIEHVYLYHPPREDIEIMIDDFNLIKNKVLAGKAHELSEGDTMYLGAATKAATSKDRRSQPFSDITAKPRAFSLKNSYMTYVLNNYILEDRVLYNFKDQHQGKIIESIDAVDRGKERLTFEEKIIRKLNDFIGLDEKYLFKTYANDINQASKDKYSLLTLRLLGLKSNSAEEFIKSNISIKNIRVSEKKEIMEHMSFPNFVVMELVKEDWENSTIYSLFEETKFLFNIFMQDGDSYIYKGAKLWNMPQKDIEGTLKKEWNMYKSVFQNGVKFSISGTRVLNNIPTAKDTKIIHVRPHASKSAYKIASLNFERGNIDSHADRLPNGDYMTKQCFWLNREYILEQIEDYL